MGQFTHLHVHSEYSLLDGAIRIKDLPKHIKDMGMKSVALTDHGVMYGAIDFYKECKKNDIKPIIGCEVYVAPYGRTRHDKEPELDKKANHLILLAKNNEGYHNLCKIVSEAFVSGYYYKPRCDIELLKKYSNGIICLTGCLAGAVPNELVNGDYERAKKIALEYKGIFKDDYYIEIQNNGIYEQNKANAKLIKLARQIDVPIVATNDAHYLKKEDSFNQEILMCIQTGKKITDEDRMSFKTEELYLKSAEEMENYFDYIPEAIENTNKIADKCNIEFEFGKTILPNYDVPEEFETHYDYLKDLCEKGLKQRYETIDENIRKRADYELEVISKMGYVDYYLIVWDFINYAKSVGIPVGPGRGSGAGSILAYSIGITDVDPIKYGLIFERFLNPERISMPDFDIDFDYERRQEVIDYVARKYGHEHVSQIITFGTMSARMVIRDVARVLDMPYSLADKIAKLIPSGPKVKIDDAFEKNIEFKRLYEEDKEIKKLIDIAKKLEGMPRQASTHACGVVITKEPVENYVPLYVRDEQISTQYIMTTLEELGLLKMDFLGLRNLTVISDTIKAVKENYGIDVEFDEDMSDPKVYELWQKGDTSGIFQFESQGMTSFMKELKPDCLEDLIAGVSLYRPGPMDQIPRYIKGKQDQTKIEYTHKSLENILKVTYGCMVYQEQVMQIVRELAGYSYGRADLVRRAMGKKKLDVMMKEREIFINGLEEDGKIVIPGCIRNGIDEKSANKIFDEMAEFAKYAFNKSHAACYAVIAYRTAYLKRYYPAEFIAAMLNSFIGNLDKVPEYIAECEKLGIEILKPDINCSQTKFVAKDNKIRFGLGSIKNVGLNIIEKIIKDREENGVFKDFGDFVERATKIGANKKLLESIIRSGTLDCFGKTRSTLMASYEDIVDIYTASEKNKLDGQFSIFDDNKIEDVKYKYYELEEIDRLQKLKDEKEMLGIYTSGNPLDEYKIQIKNNATFTSLDAKHILENENIKFKDKQKVIYYGIINKVQKRYTKNNNIMAIITVEDFYGTIEILAFENNYLKYEHFIKENNIIRVEGSLSIKEEMLPTIILEKIQELEKKDKEIQMQKRLVVEIDDLNEIKKEELRKFIRTNAKISPNIEIFVKQNGVLKTCGNINFNKEKENTLAKITSKFQII